MTFSTNIGNISAPSNYVLGAILPLPQLRGQLWLPYNRRRERLIDFGESHDDNINWHTGLL